MKSEMNYHMRAIIFIIANCVLAAAIPIHAQGTASSQGSPVEIVRLFCTMDEEGKRLSAEGGKQLAPILAEQNSRAPSEITVIEAYVVPVPERPGSYNAVTVNYNVWGSIDSSLRFTRLEGPFLNRPTVVSETMTVVPSDKASESATDGQLQQTSKSSSWRISRAPSEPHVSVETAINYVSGVIGTLWDPTAKMKAQKTLAELEELHQFEVSRARSTMVAPRGSPMEVLSRFTALQSTGAGLTADGSKQLESFFVQPSSWRQGGIQIAKSYSVEDVPSSGNKAELHVEYVALGMLDPSLRFISVSPGRSIVRQDYTLVRNSLPTQREVAARGLVGPGMWRIEDAPAEQWITVNAGIRYLTQMRETTADPVVRRNAESTLATLARYR